MKNWLKGDRKWNLGFRTVAFTFAAPKSWGTKAKPGQNRAFQKPALCENFRIVPVKTKRCRRKKIAAYSCFWPQNQSNSYFDLCQKHEKTSPQNKFSRLVLTAQYLQTSYRSYTSQSFGCNLPLQGYGCSHHHKDSYPWQLQTFTEVRCNAI